MDQAILTPESFISGRVEQYQNWYDKKSVTVKARYLNMRRLTVIGGGVVPALVNFHIPDVYGVPINQIVVTAISLMVVILVSLESVYHYREQWKNYRSTEQLLGHEKFAFLSGVGVYARLDKEKAFKLFVERVEDAIRSENAATLNVMTMANEAAATTRVQHHDPR